MRQVHEVHGLPDHGAVDPPPPLLLQADRGRQTPEPTAPGPQPPEPARLMVLTGCGFSTTQQPSLCQKSLIFAVASSFPPSRGAAPVQRPPHGVTPWGRVGDLVGVAEPVGMDLGEAERVGSGGRDIQSPDSPNQPQIHFPPTEQRQRHSGDPQRHPETPRDPGASHTHPEELPRPPGTGRDAAAGWGDRGGHGKSQLPEPGSYKYPGLSEKRPEVWLFRSGSKADRGEKQNKPGTLPQNRHGPGGGQAKLGRQRVWKEGSPPNWCFLPSRPDKHSGAQAPGGTHGTHRPRRRAQPGAAAESRARPRSPGRGRARPELAAPANGRRPHRTGQQEESLPLPRARRTGWVQRPRRPAGASCPRRGGAGPAAAGTPETGR